MLKTSNVEKRPTALQIKAITEIWGKLGENSASTLSGFSMWPFIKPGSRLVVEHNLNKIRLGEIVVFHHQDRLIAHRVVKRIKKTPLFSLYLTKGDFNKQFDQLVLSKENILGKVEKIITPVFTINCNCLFWRSLNFFMAIYSYSKAVYLTKEKPPIIKQHNNNTPVKRDKETPNADTAKTKIRNIKT